MMGVVNRNAGAFIAIVLEQNLQNSLYDFYEDLPNWEVEMENQEV